MARGHKRLRGKSWEFSVYDPTTKTYRRQTLPAENGQPVGVKRADAALRRFVEQVEQEAANPVVARSCDELFDRWWRNASGDWAPGTYNAFDGLLRNHIRPRFGAVPVGSVTGEMLDDFYADMEAKGLSKGTVGKAHVVLNLAFKQAVRYKWITYPPTLDAKKRTAPPRPIVPPSKKAARDLLDEAETMSPGYALFLHLAADTGARRSMILGLRWDRVDLDTETVTWSETVVAGRRTGTNAKAGLVVQPTTKTKKEWQVAVHWTTTLRLSEEKKRQQADADRLGLSWSDTRFVFTSRLDGSRPWYPSYPSTQFRRLRSRLSLDVRLHDLRHYMATTYLSLGVDQRTVMGRGGWASLASLTRYAAWTPAADRAAASKVGDHTFG